MKASLKLENMVRTQLGWSDQKIALSNKAHMREALAKSKRDHSEEKATVGQNTDKPAQAQETHDCNADTAVTLPNTESRSPTMVLIDEISTKFNHYQQQKKTEHVQKFVEYLQVRLKQLFDRLKADYVKLKSAIDKKQKLYTDMEFYSTGLDLGPDCAMVASLPDLSGSLASLRSELQQDRDKLESLVLFFQRYKLHDSSYLKVNTD